MPRKSPYEIVLSQDEANELAKRARKYTLPYYQVQRAKIVLLAAEGLANSEIAKRLDTRREVACFWRKRFFWGIPFTAVTPTSCVCAICVHGRPK